MAYKNRKNKVKFKLQWPLIVLVVCLIAMLVATIIMQQPSAAETKTAVYNDAISAYNDTNSTSYTTLEDDNVYVNCDQDSIASKISSTGYTYVLYGSLNQEVVLENLSVIDAAADDNDIKTVYFFSSEWVEGQDDVDATEFKLAHEGFEETLNKGAKVEKFSMLTYPTLLVFKDGELVFNTQAYTDDDYTDAWATYIQKAFYTFNTKSEEK